MPFVHRQCPRCLSWSIEYNDSGRCPYCRKGKFIKWLKYLFLTLIYFGPPLYLLLK